MNIKRLSNYKKIKLRRIRIDNGGTSMAVLAKGKPIMFNIRQSKAREFIEDCNKKVISESFVRECKEAAGLFRKKN